MMKQQYRQMQALMRQAEAEMRRAGLWSDMPPSATAMQSIMPFMYDTLRFHEWLQWVFLPRMHLIIEQDLPLPFTSGICEMAEVRFADQLREVRQLLESLRAFDRLIGA